MALTVESLTLIEVHRTFESMERHGGGFCSQLAKAWYVADRGNKNRLEQAFPHLLADFGPGSRYYGES